MKSPSATEMFWLAPKSERAELVRQEQIRRLELLEHLEEHPEDRATMMAHYATDCLAWIRDWVWTYDPRIRAPESKRTPLILWPAQVEMVEFILDLIDRGKNGGIKKARDVGATYLMGAVADWFWLFHPEITITFGSRKEALVDKRDDPKCIFYKLRDILEHLPSWMMPAGYDRREHDNHLKLVNPENRSVITGEAGDEMGRGGRSTVYFLDEFAFVPRANRVDASVNDNAATVIYASTSNGSSTLFCAKEKQGHMPFFYHTWRQDPRKDEAWKAEKLEDVGPTIFAQEHELDDDAAMDNVVIPSTWVSAAVELELREGNDRAAGLDVADQGSDSNALARRNGPVFLPLIVWQQVEGKGSRTRSALPSDSARRALAVCSAEGVTTLIFDRTGIGAAVAGVLQDEAPGGLRYEGVNNGEGASQIVYEDDPRKTARERFANRGTELWWNLRRYFERTYKHVEGIEEYPEDELISIPDDPVLFGQLSSRRYEVTEKGKLQLESKKKMKARGVKSPDRADAVVLARAPLGRREMIREVVYAEYDPYDDFEDGF